MNTILAVETSCDDTSVSIISDRLIESNIISSQVDHSKLGGVVPEIASRAHQKNIIYIVESALSKSGKSINDLDAIAYTNGPGLLGSLLVGSTFAKSLGYALDVPLISVNHLKAHALSHTINNIEIKYPFISLLVSGGHTQIILVSSYSDMKIIGETRDDAVGEAFDKCAKILGLDYPGGPILDNLSIGGDAKKFSFPDARVPDFDYSFSGIKTSFLYFIKSELEKNTKFIEQNINDICASIQSKLVSMLIKKLILAVNKYDIKDISLCGGVAANSLLRSEMKKISKNKGLRLHIPAPEYCTDNAAMIANYASFMFKEKEFSGLDTIPFSKNIIG